MLFHQTSFFKIQEFKVEAENLSLFWLNYFQYLHQGLHPIQCSLETLEEIIGVKLQNRWILFTQPWGAIKSLQTSADDTHSNDLCRFPIIQKTSLLCAMSNLHFHIEIHPWCSMADWIIFMPIIIMIIIVMVFDFVYLCLVFILKLLWFSALVPLVWFLLPFFCVQQVKNKPTTFVWSRRKTGSNAQFFWVAL